MIWGVVIILAFSALLALIVYLYQEHVEHLNYTIEMLRVNKDILGEEIDNYKELVEDLDGYYEKWREIVAELDCANQKVWELSTENVDLERENAALEIINEELEQRIHCFEEYE